MGEPTLTSPSPPPVRRYSRSLILILLVILNATSFFYFYKSSNEFISSIEHRLSTLVENRSDGIRSWVQGQQTRLQLLSGAKEIINVFKKSSELPDAFLKEYERSYKFKNFLFISIDKSLIYSFIKDRPLGELPKGPLQASAERVMMVLANDISEFTIDPQIKRPALYVSTPVFQDQKLLGVLAAELDEKKIYEIANNYAGLGSSGEVLLLTKGSEHGTSVIINPSRNNPSSAFQEYVSSSTGPNMWLKPLQGITGAGIGKDYRGIESFGAWSYISQVNWGILAKIDYYEVNARIRNLEWLCYFLVFLTLVYIVYLILTSPHYVENVRNKAKLYLSFKNYELLLSSLSVLGLLCTVYFVFKFHVSQNASEGKLKSFIKDQTDNFAQNINQNLYNIQSIGNSIAEDLNSGHLKKEDLKIRMQRDIDENPAVFGIIIAYAAGEYDQTENIFVLEAAGPKREGIKYYPVPSNFLTEKQRETGWGKLLLDPATGKVVKPYFSPFFKVGDLEKNTPIGFVSTLYEIAGIKNILTPIKMSKTSYAMVVSNEGTFLYYPEERYVKHQMTLLSMAQSSSQEFIDIAEKIISGGEGFDSFYDPHASETFWIYYRPIPNTHWEVAMIVNAAEGALGPEVIRYYYTAIISMAAFTFLCLASMTLLYFFKIRRSRQ